MASLIGLASRKILLGFGFGVVEGSKVCLLRFKVLVSYKVTKVDSWGSKRFAGWFRFL